MRLRLKYDAPEKLKREEMYLKGFVLLSLIFLLLCPPYLFSAEENITLSTYYPSPKGIYKTLRLYPTLGITSGSFCCSSPDKKGEIVYSDNVGENRILVCGNSCNWEEIKGGLWELNSQDGYLYPRDSNWSVAIGANSLPSSFMGKRPKLHVAGAISRQETTLLGGNTATHLNLGIRSITGNPCRDISFATVSGGEFNVASGQASVVSGGVSNIASGRASFVAGGENNQADGDYSWAGGRGMRLTPLADNTFVWGNADPPISPPLDTANAFIIDPNNSGTRVIIGRPDPAGPATRLRVMGIAENTSGLPLPNLVYDSGTGGIYWAPSSIRYKTNLRPIEDVLDKLKKLRGVYFNWKESGKPSLGMIAEEVGEVIPEVVTYEPDSEYASSLDYEKLVGLLVEAVKEQEKRIADLRKGVEAIKQNLSNSGSTALTTSRQ